MFRWSRQWALLGIMLLTVACANAATSSRAFLSRYSAEWQLTPSPATFGATARTATTPVPPGSTRSISKDGPGRAQIFLDAGHGGVDWGSSGTDLNGRAIDEKVVTLQLAKQTAKRLQDDGFQVLLSRSDDSTPGAVASDYTKSGTVFTPLGVLHDLQHRIDRANASGATVLVSFHLNAFSDPAVRGSETFYDSARTFGDENQRLARLIQSAVLASLKSAGVAVSDRGVTDDLSLTADDFGSLGEPYPHLVLLGPPIDGKLRASQMPGAVSEPLFLSNPADASAAGQAEVLDALANGYASAIEEYLRS